MGAECSRNESINPYGILFPGDRPCFPPPERPPIIFPPPCRPEPIWFK